MDVGNRVAGEDEDKADERVVSPLLMENEDSVGKTMDLTTTNVSGHKLMDSGM